MLICLVIKAFLKKKKALLRLPTLFCSCRADAEFDVFFGWLVGFLPCFRWDLGLFACYILFVPLNYSASLLFPVRMTFCVVFFLFWNFLRETHFVAQRLWWFLCVCVCAPTNAYTHTKHGARVEEVRELIPPYGSLALDSVSQAWWQVPLPPAMSHQPSQGFWQSRFLVCYCPLYLYSHCCA